MAGQGTLNYHSCVLEGFSYGGRLCSVVGWLGYDGNLPWRKQEYFVEQVLGVPISQGSKRQNAALLPRKLTANLSAVAELRATTRCPLCG